MTRYLLLSLCVLLLFGCEQKQPNDTLPAQVQEKSAQKLLLHESTAPVMMELPSDALMTWRDYKSQKPDLVIFSSHPMLQPIPDEMTDRALALALSGTSEDFRQHNSFFAADPELLPSQAVTAALKLKLISEIYWVYPGQGSIEDIDYVAMRDSLANQQFVTPEESGKFTLKDGIVSGFVQGVPLHLVHPDVLPTLTKPCFLHIDLSYLTTQYRNEEGTPAYELLLRFAQQLKATNWPILETTLSYSNIEGQIPLDLRFLLTDLAQIFRQPDIISAERPQLWQLRSDGLAQTTLLQHDKAFAAYRQAQELAPEDASAQFDLYLSFSALKKPQQALAALDRAVTLDKGYSFEYLNLAAKVIPQGGLVEGLALLEKAIRNMDDPGFVLIQSVSTQLEAGHSEEAQKLLEQAKQLPWSSAYHADVSAYLPKLQKQIEEKTN